MKRFKKWLMYGVTSLFALSILMGVAPKLYANQNEDISAEQIVINFFEALKAGDSYTMLEISENKRYEVDNERRRMALSEEKDEIKLLEYKILSTERVNREKFIVNADVLYKEVNITVNYPVILVNDKWIVDLTNTTQELTSQELKEIEELTSPKLNELKDNDEEQISVQSMARGTLVRQYSSSGEMQKNYIYYTPTFNIRSSVATVTGYQYNSSGGSDLICYYGMARFNILLGYFYGVGSLKSVSGNYPSSSWFSPINFTDVLANTITELNSMRFYTNKDSTICAGNIYDGY